MCIHCYSKNNYIISTRNFLDDYSYVISRKIDMTMSGKYLGKYPLIDMNLEILDQYPKEEDIQKLENIIRKKNNIKNQIIIGNGSNGILQNLVKIYVKKNDNLLTPFYSFNQVEYAATSLGATTKRILMDEEKINFNRILNSIDKRTKLIYICNPNNPTGIYVDPSNIINLSNKVSKINKNIKIVVDESAIEFTNQPSITNYKLPSNIIVVRTLSKAYGIANLRIGYMICNDKEAETYKENVTNHEVSSMLCQIAIQVIESNLYKDNVKLIIKEREKIRQSLKKIGIETYPSNSNVLLTKNYFTPEEISLIEDNDISVVKVIDENNKIHIRLAIQEHKTNDSFITQIKKIFNNYKEKR